MAYIECNAGQYILHCYKDGEWVETYGHWVTDIEYEVTELEAKDLSEYDEVRLIEIGASSAGWESEEETVNALITKYKMPDGSEIEITEPLNVDWDTFDSAGDGDYVDYTSYTKEGSRAIPDDELTEDDEDWGW